MVATNPLRISQYIEELKRLQVEHGDLYIYNSITEETEDDVLYSFEPSFPQISLDYNKNKIVEIGNIFP